MSRRLLILAMLMMSGSGCIATRTLLSNIEVTPPRISIRKTPCEDTWPVTAVAVTYASETAIPAPCSPSPASPVGLVEIVEADLFLAPVPFNEPEPIQTASALEAGYTSQLAEVLVSDATPAPLESAAPPIPLVSTPLLAPQLSSVSATTSVDPVVPAPPADTVPSAQSAPGVAYFAASIKPVAYAVSTSSFPFSPIRIAPHSPADTHVVPAVAVAPVDQHDQAVVASLDVVSNAAGQALVPPVPAFDLSELLTEIRQQRQLIEALQRDLIRERNADDAEIEELEAAVDGLLVLTRNTASAMAEAPQK